MLSVVHCDLAPVSGVVCCEAGGELRPPVTCTVYSEEQAALYCTVLYCTAEVVRTLCWLWSPQLWSQEIGDQCVDAEVEDMGRLTCYICYRSAI